MKRLIALVLAIAVMVSATALVPAGQVFAATDSKSEVCGGVSAVAGGTGCTGSTTDINRIITLGLNIFSVVIGIIAVVMIMVAGFKYITSGGDSGNVTSAKHTLIYAVVGLVVVALAQFFVQFVLDKVKT